MYVVFKLAARTQLLLNVTINEKVFSRANIFQLKNFVAHEKLRAKFHRFSSLQNQARSKGLSVKRKQINMKGPHLRPTCFHLF